MRGLILKSGTTHDNSKRQNFKFKQKFITNE